MSEDELENAMYQDHMAAMELSQLCAEQADRIAELEQKLKRVEDALENGTPPGDCWIRKLTIRAALRDQP